MSAQWVIMKFSYQGISDKDLWESPLAIYCHSASQECIGTKTDSVQHSEYDLGLVEDVLHCPTGPAVLRHPSGIFLILPSPRGKSLPTSCA